MPVDPLPGKPGKPKPPVNPRKFTDEDIEASFLRNEMHLGLDQTAGILGNSSVETGGTFSPHAYNPGENAIGIAQWEKGRREELQKFAADRGAKETDLIMQLQFMQHEANTGYRSALTDLQHATSPEQAAAVWDAEYEHSSGQQRQDRENRAAQIRSELSSGKVALNAPITANGSPVSGGNGGGLNPNSPGVLDPGGGVASGGIWNDLVGAGIAVDTGAANTAQKIWGAVTSWQKAVELIGAFFGSLLWIFNVDHFMKFMLYVFGAVAVGIGLGLISFGAGKNEGETA